MAGRNLYAIYGEIVIQIVGRIDHNYTPGIEHNLTGNMVDGWFKHACSCGAKGSWTTFSRLSDHERANIRINAIIVYE